MGYLKAALEDCREVSALPLAFLSDVKRPEAYLSSLVAPALAASCLCVLLVTHQGTGFDSHHLKLSTSFFSMYSLCRKREQLSIDQCLYVNSFEIME